MNTTLAGGVLVALLVGGVIGYSMAPQESPTESQTEAASMYNTPQVTAAEGTNEWKIQNAKSAAPASISSDATVLDWPDADGKLAELHKGTNGWTCFPDSPTTPGNDPACMDAQSMMWFQAYMSKQKPKIAQAGLTYMLQGGSDPSNTDPYATAPAAGEDWMHAPPHIMVLPVTPADPKIYGTDMNSGGPWVMWANTPYAHLMMPVQ